MEHAIQGTPLGQPDATNRDANGPPVRWTQEFGVHSFDVDFRRHASIETVCRFFMEAAWNHAEALGFGFSHLAAQGKVWVLSRLSVRVVRNPQWGETVCVRTWPRATKSVFAMRDFQLLSGAGDVMASGASAWLVLDANSRRPQRPERVLSRVPALPAERALPEDPEKIPAVAASPGGPPFRVRYSDLDVNNHVNSCRYLRWVLDAYPVEFHAAHIVAQLEANYLGETHAGEALALRSDTADASVHAHCLTKADNGTEVCRVRLTWR